LHVRLAADAASVAGVRRFVSDGLDSWGDGRFAEAAELVASELTTNVALHAGAEFMYVTLERTPDGVRVSVEDDGPLGADVVQARTPAGEDLTWSELDATGRGLAIVGMIAQSWGVGPTDRGKHVWADLADPEEDPDPSAVPAQPEAPHVPDGPRPDGPGPEGLPPGWVMVRLAGCPVELSLQQDRHLDELVRELQLLSVDESNPESAALAQEIRGLLASPTHARLTGRRTAERARDEGRDVVDIDMAMPREFSGLVAQLHVAVARADELCREGRLLTLASPPEIRELRAWMTHEVSMQATTGAAPITWADWQSQAG
jgi:anti-sigma regulatory factor (Ser/Thr protein kinase)